MNCCAEFTINKKQQLYTESICLKNSLTALFCSLTYFSEETMLVGIHGNLDGS